MCFYIPANEVVIHKKNNPNVPRETAAKTVSGTIFVGAEIDNIRRYYLGAIE